MSSPSVIEHPAPVRLPATGLDDLMTALRGDGRTIVAPVIRDDVITLAEVASVDELPLGWRDRQEPGHYRGTDDQGRERFGHAAPAQPWKRWLHPERTLLVRGRRSAEGVEFEPPAPEPKLAFLGIRPCDLAALRRLDVVLANDEGYRRRRADLVTIAVACATPASTCFCASMDTGPGVGPGADLALDELADGTLLATPHTAAGRRLLDTVAETRPANRDEQDRATARVRAAADAQTRRLDPDAVAAASAEPDHPGWSAVAERCLTCGNCTHVCPTCFCTSVEDATPLDGSVERWQRWDSCFSLGFSYVHGGSVRVSPASRYRQWFLHKLVTWHDQFDASGCVGCGRCITWCPTGIDLTEGVVS